MSLLVSFLCFFLSIRPHADQVLKIYRRSDGCSSRAGAWRTICKDNNAESVVNQHPSFQVVLTLASGVVDNPDRRQALGELVSRLGGKLACGDEALLVSAWIELLPSNRLRFPRTVMDHCANRRELPFLLSIPCTDQQQ